MDLRATKLFRQLQDGPDDEAPAEGRAFRVRDVFQFGRPATYLEPEGEHEQAPAAAAVPPLPAESAVVPRARVGREATQGGHRVPDWWDQDKTLRVSAAGGDDTGCTHPNPRTVRVGTSDQYVPYWCPDCKSTLTLTVTDSAPAPAKAPTGPAAPDPAQDKEDQEGGEPGPDGEEDQAEGAGEEGVVPEQTGRLARWRPALQRAVESGYRPAPYEVRPAPRQSVAEWWRSLDATRRWMLYNAAPLAAGFALHIPQAVTSRTAYVVTTYHSWSDVHVVTCYVIAAVVWVVDHASRRWPFLFALILRVPLASLVIGALLYGNADNPSEPLPTSNGTEMHSVLGTLGPVGFALVLAIVLWVGTKGGGGKAKSLTYGWTLFLALLAGASLKAGGWPFNLIPALCADMVGLLAEMIPGLTMPALTLGLVALLMWFKLSTRQVAFMGIFLFYCATGADGFAGTLAGKIAQLAQHLAA